MFIQPLELYSMYCTITELQKKERAKLFVNCCFQTGFAIKRTKSIDLPISQVTASPHAILVYGICTYSKRLGLHNYNGTVCLHLHTKIMRFIKGVGSPQCVRQTMARHRSQADGGKMVHNVQGRFSNGPSNLLAFVRLFWRTSTALTLKIGCQSELL